MESPRQVHLQAVKRIMRYIKGTTTFGLFYSSSKKIEIVRYSNNDGGGDSSKKRSIVALSTCEAEYVAATTSSCQSV